MELSKLTFVAELRTKKSLCCQGLVPAATQREAEVNGAVQPKPGPCFPSDALQLLQKSH